MSDYVHIKGVFYPIDEEELKQKYNLEELYDIGFLPQFKEIFNRKDNNFDIECMVEYDKENYPYHNYLVYNLYYGEGNDDFGRNRFLTKKEQEKYKPLFEEILGEIDTTKLKYVDYCWYNCCASEDYYLKEDDFSKEI